MMTCSIKLNTFQDMKKTLSKILILAATINPSADAHAKVYSKAFASDYDSVWKGILISLSKYPLDRNDQESGEIKTSVLSAGEVFKTYDQKINPKERYQIFINVEKRRLQGRDAVIVHVEKKPFIKGDFMRAEKEIKSDGIEERVLLYRTLREVKIDQKLSKLFE